MDPPPPPYDPPPPPYDPPPPPPPVDPAPYPGPYIVDCVPDKMDSPGQPGSGASASIGRPDAVLPIQPRIVAGLDRSDGSWVLEILDRAGGAPQAVSVTWICGSGTLSSTSGPVTRWTPPRGRGVHAVMAVAAGDGEVVIETIKIFT